jgi:Activator of Hsp90 ATPase homolog 1-like protein
MKQVSNLQGEIMSDLTSTFTVDATPQEAFDAINDVRSWWSGNIVGPTDKVGAEWFYLVPDIHFSKQLVTELVPYERVVWEFTDGYLDFIADKKEWIGTTGRFDITEEDRLTRVTFTHDGLAHSDECFDVCHDAWTHYITVSLKGRIETGTGQIRTREEDEAAIAR